LRDVDSHDFAAERDSDGKAVRMGLMNTRLGVLYACEYAEKTSSVLDEGTQREGVGAGVDRIGSWSTILDRGLANLLRAANDLVYDFVLSNQNDSGAPNDCGRENQPLADSEDQSFHELLSRAQ
jgi:hypothetical protein